MRVPTPHLKESFLGFLRNMLRLLAIHSNLEVSGTEGIGLDLGEVTGADTPFKQDVNLSGTESFRFGKSEIRPNEGEKAKATPHEPALSFQIPSSRIENRWVEEVGHDACDVITVASNDNTLDTQTCRWNLRDKTVTDGSDCDVVGEHKQHEEATRDPAQDSRAVIWDSHKSDSDKNDEHDSQAI